MRLPPVSTVAADRPFADALAFGLHAHAGFEPLALSRALVLLPTRRACRTVRDAFLRLSGGRPLLLPRLMAVSDLDDDEPLFATTAAATALAPALDPLRRQMLLTRLILAGHGARGAGQGGAGRGPGPEQAAHLALELGRFLDQVQAERLSFEALATLVPDDYAAHWQVTLDFLRILTEVWPSVVAAEGCLDRAVRRDRLAAATAAAWRDRPPRGPVVAAGFAHADPATADLLAAVAALPDGLIVLPGLDRTMDDEDWATMDDSHPQAGLRRILDQLGIARATVAAWPDADGGHPVSPPHPDRLRLIRESMRPAATTERWRTLPPLAPAALDGVERIDCPTPREEALAIALALRQVLETPGATAALVTPDRALARRVAGELGRWGITIDDSAGVPLRDTGPGTFLRLIARMVADAFAPVALLAALKHPLAACGLAPPRFRTLVRALEVLVLRGPRPGPGIDGLRAALSEPRTNAREQADVVTAMARLGVPGKMLVGLLDRLDRATADLAATLAEPDAPLADLVRAHMECAERLAAADGAPGAARLWQGEAGTAAADFAADLLAAADVLPGLDPSCYPGLFDAFLDGQTVRPLHGRHPRLAILGPLEARLHHPDRLILGGLNEGTWPPTATTDPWMSRPMRSAFGLPLPERRIGLAAHDFVQAFCAPSVVLTRSERVDGTPTVPSRWLLRLEAVLRAGGLGDIANTWGVGEPWLHWAGALDRPVGPEPAVRPAPCPPVSARPSRLSVTEIETWMRDPYAIYARHILRLRALAPIDADPGAADYGSIVHSALETFTKAFPRDLPVDVEASLLVLGRGVFAPLLGRPAVWAFWWPRFSRIAGWVAQREVERRGAVAEVLAEVSGSLELARTDPGLPPFRLVAKADRVDRLHDGSLVLIDYKTGAPPKVADVVAGLAPQLPLEAAIAAAGGFAAGGVPAAPVSDLLYWRLSGGRQGGEERVAADDPPALAEAALEGLARLIAAFDRQETPYESRPHPGRAPAWSDYLHLARVKEWATAES